MAFGGWLGDNLGEVLFGVKGEDIAGSAASAVEDVARNELSFMDDVAHFDFEGMHDREAEFEDIGNSAFGTGGWYKALASYYLGPFADAAANTIENKGDAESSWRNAAKNYVINQGVNAAANYASSASSDYSLTNNGSNTSSLSGNTSSTGSAGDYSLSGSNAGLGNNTGTSGYGGTSSAGDYSLSSGSGGSTGFSGNTKVDYSPTWQQQWADYKQENPTTGAAVEGAAKGGVKAAAKGGNPLEGALYGGATNAAATAISEYSQDNEKEKAVDNSFFNNESSLADTYGSSLPSFNPSYTDGTGGAGYGVDMTNLGKEQDWMSQLKNNPWLQTTLGIAGGFHPALGALGKAVYGSGENRASNPMYNIGATLGQLYSNNRAQQAIKGQLGQFDANRGAYQSQLEKALARKDAASGRRSQYGPRSVELQARMAALDAQRAPSLMKMYDAESALRNQNVSNVLNSAWTNRDAIKSGYNSLKDYFSSGE